MDAVTARGGERETDGGAGAQPSAAVGEVTALALLSRAGGVDREQLLAFQYSKLVRRGDRVADVGAHSGLHAGRLARLVGPTGRVLIVEPIDDVFDRFLFPLYGADRRCQLFRGAMSDRPGRAPFFVVLGSEQESGLIPRRDLAQPTRREPLRTEVAVSTLDDLLAGGRVSFVKIDVEGAEHRVLAGARRTLEIARPVVALETSDAISTYGTSLEDLHALVVGLGYEVATVAGVRLSRPAFLAAARSGVIWDFFLLPVERAGAVCDVLREPASPFLDDVCVDLRATVVGPHAEGLVGFSAVESWGRWTDARVAAPAALVQLSRPLPDQAVLEVVVMGAVRGGTPFELVVGGEAQCLFAPEGVLATASARFRRCGGVRLVAFRPRRTTSGRGDDPRRLGVGVQALRVLPGDGQERDP